MDNSAELAGEARVAFAAGLAAGEAGLQLARQALLIAAEDDAIGEGGHAFQQLVPGASRGSARTVSFTGLDGTPHFTIRCLRAAATMMQAEQTWSQLFDTAVGCVCGGDNAASSSVVRFPVDAYLERIRRLAADTAAAVAVAAAEHSPGPASSSSSSSSSALTSNEQWSSIRNLPPSEVIAAVEHALFAQQQPQRHQRHSHAHTSTSEQQQQQPQPAECWYSGIRSAGYKAPAFGRSNLPQQSMLDHPGKEMSGVLEVCSSSQHRPLLHLCASCCMQERAEQPSCFTLTEVMSLCAGVWEDARLAYLHEVLVRKTGSPAALVILYCEVYRQLLLMGAIDCAVTFDYG